MVTGLEMKAYADAHNAAQALERIAVALEAMLDLANRVVEKLVDKE